MNEKSCLQERDSALKEIYQKIIKVQGINMRYLKRKTILSFIAEHPAPRFYLKPYMAEMHIRRYYANGCQPRCKRGLKSKMVLDLVHNYEVLKTKHPDMPIGKIFEMVVEQPAQSFYMREKRIEEIIFNVSGRNGKGN